MTDANGNRVTFGNFLYNSGLLPWAIAAAITAAIWMIGNASQADYTAKNLNDFKTQVSSQIIDLKTQMNSNFAALQTQISALPDYAARLNAVEHHVGTIDTHLSALDGRADGLERQTYQMSITLGDITKASEVPLGRHK